MPRARKSPAPPLPRVTLHRVPVQVRATMLPAASTEHDIVAKRNGKTLKRWPWWAADKPRSRRARTMVLDGVRYRTQFAGA